MKKNILQALAAIVFLGSTTVVAMEKSLFSADIKKTTRGEEPVTFTLKKIIETVEVGTTNEKKGNLCNYSAQVKEIVGKECPDKGIYQKDLVQKYNELICPQVFIDKVLKPVDYKNWTKKYALSNGCWSVMLILAILTAMATTTVLTVQIAYHFHLFKKLVSKIGLLEWAEKIKAEADLTQKAGTTPTEFPAQTKTSLQTKLTRFAAGWIAMCVAQEDWGSKQWWFNPYKSSDKQAVTIGAYLTLYGTCFLVAAASIIKLMLNNPKFNINYKVDASHQIVAKKQLKQN